MITTDKIKLTSKDFFKIILNTYLRKIYWGLIFLSILVLILILQEEKYALKNFLIYFAILYPIIFVVKHRIYAYSKDNRLFLLEKHFEIYEDKIVEKLNDGSNSLIKIEHFIRVKQMKNFYLLFIAKDRFISISKSSFKSEQDKDWFEKEILSKIKE